MPRFRYSVAPPRSVADFVRNKDLRPDLDYSVMAPDDHVAAFTVAGITREDLLGSVKAAIQLAIENGETFASFRRDLEPLLVREGWLEAGDARNSRRLRTIYQSNIRSARAAGQWQRAQRTKRALPFFLYELGPSEVHRVEHAAKEGLILPVDDPFWNEWFPPNGWGCKCRLRQISEAEARRRGYRGQDAPRIRRVRHVDADGTVRSAPRGIDPSWAGNPGRARMANLAALLDRKAGTLDYSARKASALDALATPLVRSFLDGERQADMLPPIPVAALPDDVASSAKNLIEPGSGGSLLFTSRQMRTHNPANIDAPGNFEGKYFRADEWSAVVRVLESAPFWLLPAVEGGRAVPALQFIDQVDGRWTTLIMRPHSSGGFMEVVSFFRAGRRNREIRLRKEERGRAIRKR